MRRGLCALALALCSVPALAEVPLFDGGHIKGRGELLGFPEDSVFRDAVGARGEAAGGSLRLKFASDPGPWQFSADYQLLAESGDRARLAGDGGLFRGNALPDDDYRWWDLSSTIDSGDSWQAVQRLDRLNLSWTGERAVVRFGRQAVSWGNGLIYNPMDFFNPFDPAAVDTEYKPGDDMLYAQYLRESGDDWQLVNVQRRDASGELDATVSSTALKYHGFDTQREYDLLLAQHYDQTLLAAGGLANVGAAVLRGDLVLTEAEQGWVAQAVLDWTFSWVWGERNVSAVAEYFYNGFGLRESDYGELLASDAPGRGPARVNDLRERLLRGDLFSVGRHYFAGSLLVEMTPLFSLTPTLLCNLGDGSALAQLIAQWDPAQDWQLLGALNVPLGGTGTEFGGLETGIGDRTLASGPALLVQVAWYF